MAAPFRVLGIDPGSRVSGFGVVEARGSELHHLAHGVLRLSAELPLELRLTELFERLCAALDRWSPHAVAVEGVFAFRNARSALVLGQARGVALLAAARGGRPVFEYAPAAVKRAVGASGAASKDAVGLRVRAFLGIRVPVGADASDALAVAVCHLHRSRVAALFPGSPRGRRRPPAWPRLSPAVYGAPR
ncbi:MAG TPA: crossover junction endodeoxyribonuclease RuvC [Myxococcaceae bacterium]|nr:crossover junction endodeoxyribonuclease RuvC [Myxococcaceae bacterium]